MKENNCGLVLNLKQSVMAGHQENVMSYKGFGASEHTWLKIKEKLIKQQHSL